jgi:hypothetical protein
MTFLLAARPDFGFGNPNLAAAFFAMLAVAAWIIPALGKGSRPPAFWISLAVSVASSCFLAVTASRGGALALFVGLFACWAAAGFCRASIAQTMGVVAASVLVLASAASSRMGERVAGSSPSDGSIAARLEIWRKVPAMLAASPRGWGQGKAAGAYQNWFQEIDDTRTYKHLVSTHATWMSEHGWGFRFGYLLGLAAVLLVCWEIPAAFGVWIAFMVAGIFSHVGADWRLWALPSASLVFALACRARRLRWPARRAWGYCLAFAAATTLLLWAIGHAQNRGIADLGWGVKVGEGEPETWCLSPSASVLGASYGKPVRSLGSAYVSWDWERIGNEAPKRIILSGDPPIPAGKSFAAPYDLVWLNPPATLDEAQRQAIERASRKTVVWGELRTDASPRKLRAWLETLPESRWKPVPGKGLFLGGIAVE